MFWGRLQFLYSFTVHLQFILTCNIKSKKEPNGLFKNFEILLRFFQESYSRYVICRAGPWRQLLSSRQALTRQRS